MIRGRVIAQVFRNGATGGVSWLGDQKSCRQQGRRLLGWTVRKDEPNWVTLAPSDGGASLSFQTEPAYVRPSWPSSSDRQQMMLHLDIEVDDLDGAGAFAVGLGATLAEYQPQDDVRVYLDPSGHPFCLWVRT